MPSVGLADLQRMRDAVFFEGVDRRRRLSRFWVLLGLAAVIASAGVIVDSTATVIGAMIVAPLMTPILGIVLAIAIGDRANLVRSLLLVVAGALAVVGIAFLLGLTSAIDVVASNNSQVSVRVNPRIVDLVAALATGAVGSFALVRSDVSDTLPGVAIAIALVPPLAVAGLTLEAGRGDQARGAMLLFLTNVAAMLVTAVVVLALYHVRRTAVNDVSLTPRVSVRYPVLAILAFVVIIAIPLASSGKRYRTSALTTNRVAAVATDWAKAAEWEIVSVQEESSRVVVRAIGPPPAPDPDELRTMLDRRGQQDTDVRVELVPVKRVDLPAG